jgi:hypothetical protein
MYVVDEKRFTVLKELMRLVAGRGGSDDKEVKGGNKVNLVIKGGDMVNLVVLQKNKISINKYIRFFLF